MKVPHNDAWKNFLSKQPKFVSRWARQDIVEHWLGRTVSVKLRFSEYRNPYMVGTIIEIGVAGWTGILWEDGKAEGAWNRRELDDYQGGLQFDHRSLLLASTDSESCIVMNLQQWPLKGRRRNGFPVNYEPPDYRLLK